MVQKWMVLGLGLLVVAACATLDRSEEFDLGRQALIRGDSWAALTYFERIAQSDPNYVAPFSSFQESIWTYLGRAQYQMGKLADAKESLERALFQLPNDSVAKLYLGLTNVRLQTTEKDSNAFTLQEISFALREGIEPKSVAELARKRGVVFDLTAEAESQLRKAGADDLLLNEIKKISAEISKRKKADPKLAEQAKALTAAVTDIRDQLDYLNSPRREDSGTLPRRFVHKSKPGLRSSRRRSLTGRRF
jgi:tetratricopeptide (TPR) repeat protein